MSVRDYCRAEPRTASPDETLRDAAQRMDETGVGCLIVVDEKQRPIGMVTDRDLALGVLRGRRDPTESRVRDAMHEPVVTVTERAPLAVAVRFMRQNSLRRIPVVDPHDGKLSGLLTTDDFLPLVASELSCVAQVARSQFPADLRPERELPAGDGGGS